MSILLDTHAFLWSTGSPDRLSGRIRDLLTDTNNTWILSIASIWEMQIKIQLGKVKLNSTSEVVLECEKNSANYLLIFQLLKL